MVGAGRPWFRAGLVLGAVVLVDQLSKRIVEGSLAPGERDRVFPGLAIVHVSNKGVAFGALAGGHTAVLVVIAVAVISLLVYFIRHHSCGCRPACSSAARWATSSIACATAP
jgi:lipoprotein signal peptidase